MSGWLQDQRVFWRQFREHFHTTGSVLPSSRFLARSLARFVGASPAPLRVLEVGPGTGAITAQIVRRLRAEDRFDLVELNEQFVRRLHERFANEAPFRLVAPRCRILHQRVEELAAGEPYDVIVSGLPLNNFSVADVQRILDVLVGLLRPGGTLSFFEYIGIRRARALVSGHQERARLRGIGAALDRLLAPYEIGRDAIWPNVPPAYVHHVRLPKDAVHASSARAPGAAGASAS
jgi:phospholipid N-methyltransferase